MAVIADKAVPVHFGMIDHSSEASGTILHLPMVEATVGGEANLIVSEISTDAVKLVLAALTRLNMTKVIASVLIDESAGTIPSDPVAQREHYIKFTYADTDNGNKKYSFTVPGPVGAVIPSGTDVIDLSATLIAAFITAVELLCVSPVGGAIEILSARYGGRNS